MVLGKKMNRRGVVLGIVGYALGPVFVGYQMPGPGFERTDRDTLLEMLLECSYAGAV